MRSGLHSLRDVIPPSEACLYGHINWSLAQTQKQSSMGLSQSFPSKRGGKMRPWTGFHFKVQKRPVPGCIAPSLAKRPHLKSGNGACPSGRKSAGGNVSTSSTNARLEGVHGGWCSWCVMVLSLLMIFICSFSGWYAFQIFDQWKSITSNRFVINMVWESPSSALVPSSLVP